MLSRFNESQRATQPTDVVAKALASATTPTPVPHNQEKVRYGELRQAAFWAVGDVLHLLRTRRWKVDYDVSAQFSRELELPYLEATNVEDAERVVEEAMREIVPSNDALAYKAVQVVKALDQAESSSAIIEALAHVYQLYEEVLAVVGQGVASSFFAPMSSPQCFTLATTPALDAPQHGSTLVAWPTTFGANLVEAVQHNVRWLRDQQRPPTFTEFVIEHVAYCFLAGGKQLSALSFANDDAKFLGTVGFRPVSQTYPSLTDPGDGHVFGTTRKSAWMNGAIVHVEHLERPGGVPRTLIESYRIPAILDFARVRLHTAGHMPNTYFTGRALRDSAGSFQQSFIKVVNTTSAACSQAFSLGAAECKIAMDDLSTSQMLAYLKALAGHTLRQPHQYLSCAFNLNWPVVHDARTDGLPPQLVTDPFEIAKLAIEIASAGGFDKVTWDGASDTYPSKCIIHQLSFEQWLWLAHRAHECGLTTYASAGFKFPQIKYGVWAGIDGLGIGGAQILRHMDHNSGMHGPYTEENLDRILAARDDAAAHVRGRGVAVLARMDRMFFEGSLTPREDELRGNLFAVLASADENCIGALLQNPLLVAIAAMTDDGQRPYVAWAQRLLRHYHAHEEIILQRFASFQEWDTLMTQLSLALAAFAPTSTQLAPPLAKEASRDVEDDVYDVHVGRIWTQLRMRKAEQLSAGHALSRHDNVVKIKTTPYSSNPSSRRSSRRSSAAPSAMQSPMASRRGSAVATYTLASANPFRKSPSP